MISKEQKYADGFTFDTPNGKAKVLSCDIGLSGKRYAVEFKSDSIYSIPGPRVYFISESMITKLVKLNKDSNE